MTQHMTIEDAIEQLKYHPKVAGVTRDNSTTLQEWNDRFDGEDFPPPYPGFVYRVKFRDGLSGYFYADFDERGTLYPALSADGGKFGVQIRADGGVDAAIHYLYNGPVNARFGREAA